MKNSFEAFRGLRFSLGKIFWPMALGILVVALLLAAEFAFRHSTDYGHDNEGYIMFVLGVLSLLILVYYYPVKRVKVEGRLENALCILQRLVDQEAIDNELRSLARLVDVASRRQIKAQNEVGLARTEEEEQDLRKEEVAATIHFESLRKDFHDFCEWAESAGYEVRKTSKGKPSFKLYLPKREAVSPALTSRDREYLGDPEPPI